MQAPSKKSNRKTRSWKHRGILADAKTLGVERSHLYRVLTGERKNADLLSRYEALKREQRQTADSLRNLESSLSP